MATRTACPDFGSAFKQSIRDSYPARLYLDTAGEMLARYENRVEIDPDGAWVRGAFPS